MAFPAKYRGDCPGCGKPIRKGQMIDVLPGTAPRHAACRVRLAPQWPYNAAARAVARGQRMCPCGRRDVTWHAGRGDWVCPECDPRLGAVRLPGGVPLLPAPNTLEGPKVGTVVGWLALGGVAVVMAWLLLRRRDDDDTLSPDWPKDGEGDDGSVPSSEAGDVLPEFIPVAGGVATPRDLSLVPRARLERVLRAIRQVYAEAQADPDLAADLPPLAWFIAFAVTESALDPSAYRADSRVYGLYQFKEGTARMLGWRGRNPRALFDPAISTRLMARAIVYYRRRGRTRCDRDDLEVVALMHNKGHAYCPPRAPRDFLASYLPQINAEVARATELVA